MTRLALIGPPDRLSRQQTINRSIKIQFVLITYSMSEEEPFTDQYSFGPQTKPTVKGVLQHLISSLSFD